MYRPPVKIGSGSWATAWTGARARTSEPRRDREQAPHRTASAASTGAVAPAARIRDERPSSRAPRTSSAASAACDAPARAADPVATGASRIAVDGREPAGPGVERRQPATRRLEHDAVAGHRRRAGAAHEDRRVATRLAADDGARVAAARLVGDDRPIARHADDGTRRPDRRRLSGHRVDDARPAARLAARGHGQPAVRCPAQLRAERPAVAGIRREPRDESPGAAPVERHAPHAEVRAGRPIHAVLDHGRSVRRHERGPHDRVLLGEERRAAGLDVHERQPRPCPVIGTDEHPAVPRPRRERLRRQVDRPAAGTEPPDGQPLARERARVVHDPVEAEPHGRVGRRRHRGRTGRRVPRRIGRLEQRRPGERPDADERQGRDRYRTTNPSDRLHELPPPAGSTGGRRARQPSWRRATYRAVIRSVRAAQGVGCTPHRDASRPYTFDAVRSRSRCDSGTVPLR